MTLKPYIVLSVARSTYRHTPASPSTCASFNCRVIVYMPLCQLESTTFRLCLSRIRSQLYYQHGTAARRHTSWWRNEIKKKKEKSSHTSSHCVLDVCKSLLCSFCDLGETMVMNVPSGRWKTLAPDPVGGNVQGNNAPAKGFSQYTVWHFFLLSLNTPY